MSDTENSPMADAHSRGALIYRHSALVRLTHWINALCLAVLLLSGLQIFNAHPALHWGSYGGDKDPSFLEIGAQAGEDGTRGVTRIFSWSFDTTGVLGWSKQDGELTERGFPTWLTIPSYRDLATGRRWHLFFAWFLVFNGIAYLIYGLVAGHFRRDLVPDRDQLEPAHLAREIADHARLRFHRGKDARRYNALQKISYLAVIFVLLPLMLLTGLAMSPAMDAAWPWLLDIFGGRQSARSIHFISATLLVAFFIVHVTMVVLSGPFNNLRSMVTGWFATPREGAVS